MDKDKMIDKMIGPAAFAVGFLLCIGLSYLFALVGEPTSVWFWCDILGLCEGWRNG